MGNSSSSSSDQSGWTQERKDLKSLASQFAFGDDELRHVYRAYHELQKVPPAERVPFVQDWGMACYDPDSAPPPPDTATQEEGGDTQQTEGGDGTADREPQPQPPTREERIDDRKGRLQRVDAILGDFGNRLYAATFLAVGDRSVYAPASSSSSSSSSSSGTPPEADPQIGNGLPQAPTESAAGAVLVDEYTRKSRLEAVFDGLARCSRRGSQATISALFHVLEQPNKENKQDGDHAAAPNSTESTSVVDALELVTIGYHLALATAILSGDMDDVPPGFHDDLSSAKALEAFASSLSERAESQRQRYGNSGATTAPVSAKGNLVQFAEVLEWADVACPVFASILPSFLWQIFFPSRPYPPSRTAYTFPRLLLSMATLMPSSRSNHSSVADDDDDVDEESRNRRNELEANRLLNPVYRYVLACWTSSLNGPYLPLYNSEQDGLSFNRLQNALVGYSGPTLLVVTVGGNMFGAFTSSKWKEAKDFYGTSETFLYALSPKTRVYRPTLRNESYQYCNSAARSRGYDQQAHGLGFGGTVHRPRLFLSEAFEDCNADKQDLTFDNGPLMLLTGDDDDNIGSSGNNSSSNKFSPDSLQVWAVGGQAVVEAALHERGHHRDFLEQGIRRARKVDKAQFLDDLRSGAIESKAFVHRQQIDGRADQDVADRINKEREIQRQKNVF